jgi:hypothetical protein
MNNAKFIWINGIQLPSPDRGLKIVRSQLVDSGRNALGQVVAQKINRRLIKLDGLSWTYLSAADWHTIIQEVEKFTGTLKVWDALSNDFWTLQVYWGDSTEEPFNTNPDTGEIIDFINCKCNIIDMGF